MNEFYNDITEEEVETLVKDVDKSFAFANNTLISLYLKEIGEYPLLSKDEEIECAIKIKSGLELLENYKNDSLSKDDFDKHNNIISDMEIAKDKMINSNLKYVVAIAKKYSWSSLPFDELIQDGNMGLIKAVEKFDHELGYRFSTYATAWIKQSITRGISKKGSDIKLPTNIYEKLSKVKKCEVQLNFELNRKPTNKEIANKLDIKELEVEELKSYEFTFQSLDSFVKGNDDLTLQGTISDKNNTSPIEYAIIESNKKVIEEAVNKLDGINKEIIAMTYGLYGYKIHTFESIAKKFNLSSERIRQRKNTSLKLLERYLKNKL